MKSCTVALEGGPCVVWMRVSHISFSRKMGAGHRGRIFEAADLDVPVVAGPLVLRMVMPGVGEKVINPFV